MTNLLIILGVIFIVLAIRKGKVQSAGTQGELLELKQVRDELAEAKKEVGSLLEQLEAVSEKVVGEISAKVEEVKLMDNTRYLYGEQADEDDSAAEEPAADELTEDEPIEDELVEREPAGAGAVGFSARGKTIIFPRRKENRMEKNPANTERIETTRELPPKHQMVYAMAKLGYSVEEIAKQMKIGKGEVSLMLQLKRKGEEANA